MSPSRDAYADCCTECAHFRVAIGGWGESGGGGFIGISVRPQYQCMLELKPVDGWCKEWEKWIDHELL